MNIYDEIISKVNRDNFPANYDTGFSLAECISKLSYMTKNINIDFEKYKESNNFINNEVKKEIEKINKDISDILKDFKIKDGSLSLNKFDSNIMNEIETLIYKSILNMNNVINFVVENGVLYALVSDIADINFYEENNYLIMEV